MPSRRERELEELLRLRSERPARPTVDWETASRCPRCEVQMTAIEQKRSPFNLTATIHILECRNDRCVWGRERMRKMVEIMADGTIPVMLPGPKTYDVPLLTKEQQAKIDEYFEQVRLSTLRKDELRKE